MSKRLCWCTDTHLNFLTDEEVIKFALSVREQLLMPTPDEDPAGVLITGDISEAPHLVHHLSILEKIIQMPIYFVLGNHDYYRSSFDAVKSTMEELTAKSKFLKWLPCCDVISLTPETALVGHDGWYDMLNGSWQQSNFYMIDWKIIHDYVPLTTAGARAAFSAKRTQLAADHIETSMRKALETHKHVVVLTHVPPYKIAAQYQGRPTDKFYLPFFSNKLVGEAIDRVMVDNPDKSATVLAGHTHDPYRGAVSHNTNVMIGAAQYKYPRVETYLYV